jgi:hypothetical protein
MAPPAKTIHSNQTEGHCSRNVADVERSHTMANGCKTVRRIVRTGPKPGPKTVIVHTHKRSTPKPCTKKGK